MKKKKVIVFLTGIPGAGKTTAARVILAVGRRLGWKGLRLEDHAEMHALLDPKSSRVNAEMGIITLEIGAEIAERLSQRLLEIQDGLVLVEIASSVILDDVAPYEGYWEFLLSTERELGPLLRECYFLFVKAPLNEGRKRVEKRLRRPRSADDHPAYRGPTSIKRHSLIVGNEEQITKSLKRDFAIKAIVVRNSTFKWWFALRMAALALWMLLRP